MCPAWTPRGAALAPAHIAASYVAPGSFVVTGFLHTVAACLGCQGSVRRGPGGHVQAATSSRRLCHNALLHIGRVLAPVPPCSAWEAGFGSLYWMEGVLTRQRDRRGGALAAGATESCARPSSVQPPRPRAPTHIARRRARGRRPTGHHLVPCPGCAAVAMAAAPTSFGPAWLLRHSGPMLRPGPGALPPWQPWTQPAFFSCRSNRH